VRTVRGRSGNAKTAVGRAGCQTAIPRRELRSVTVVYGRTQAEAKRKLDLLKQQLESGTRTDTKLTVATLLEQYLVEKARDVETVDA
jgi:hypothetical protein